MDKLVKCDGNAGMKAAKETIYPSSLALSRSTVNSTKCTIATTAGENKKVRKIC